MLIESSVVNGVCAYFVRCEKMPVRAPGRVRKADAHSFLYVRINICYLFKLVVIGAATGEINLKAFTPDEHNGIIINMSSKCFFLRYL